MLLLIIPLFAGALLNPCWFHSPSIEGDEFFRERITAALDLLPLRWSCMVRRNIDLIRQNPYGTTGGTVTDISPAHYDLADVDVPLKLQWLAGVLVHEAGHVELPDRTGLENHCAINVLQGQALRDLGAPDRMIEYIESYPC